jgi:hypothetical protein
MQDILRLLQVPILLWLLRLDQKKRICLLASYAIASLSQTISVEALVRAKAVEMVLVVPLAQAPVQVLSSRRLLHRRWTKTRTSAAYACKAAVQMGSRMEGLDHGW